MALSYLNFAEVRLELGYHYGCVGGPEFKTDIIETGGGREQRNALWWQPLGRWQLGERALLDSDYDGIYEVEYLKSFHSSTQGSLQGFRFKDWSDYYVENQYIATTDSATSMYQLYKTYTAGEAQYRRPITKPVEGTVKIYLDGNEINYPLINYATGLMSFLVPPQSGQILTVDFEFDIPVQFEADKIEWTLDAIQLQDGATLHRLGSVFVREMRIDLDLEWYHFDPIPQTIQQPLDLGVILDTSETITFDTRVESTESGFSSNQSYGAKKIIFKLPTFKFNQEQLNTILGYFWVAKGRLASFPILLNNRELTIRFNSDALSVKFEATDDLDSLYEVPLELKAGNDLFFDLETYVQPIIDSSGSMSAYSAPVVEAVNSLREFLKETVYLSEENTNKYFKPIALENSEQWLNWTNEDLRDDESEPNKQAFLLWINESAPTYHNGVDPGMRPAFASHLETFLADYPNREKFKVFLYSVNPTGAPGGIEGFETHLELAENGGGTYPVALRNYGFVFRRAVDPAVDATYYFNDIINS